MNGKDCCKEEVHMQFPGSIIVTGRECRRRGPGILVKGTTLWMASSVTTREHIDCLTASDASDKKGIAMKSIYVTTKCSAMSLTGKELFF